MKRTIAQQAFEETAGLSMIELHQVKVRQDYLLWRRNHSFCMFHWINSPPALSLIHLFKFVVWEASRLLGGIFFSALHFHI